MFTIFIYSDVKHSKKFLGIESSGFFLLRDSGSSTNYPKIFLSPLPGKIFLSVDLHPDKFLYPELYFNSPLNNNFHVIIPTETSFLVYQNFILSVNPSHLNFDFDKCDVQYLQNVTVAFEKAGRKFPLPLYDISKAQVMLFFTCFYVL